MLKEDNVWELDLDRNIRMNQLSSASITTRWIVQSSIREHLMIHYDPQNQVGEYS